MNKIKNSQWALAGLPSSRRRRRRRRYPAAAPATTGAGATAATDPEQAPPTTGAGCRRIWGRGNKITMAYPVAEQDMQKEGPIRQHATTSRISREPDRITSRINVRIKRDKIAGYKRIKRLDKMWIYKDKDQDKRTGYEWI